MGGSQSAAYRKQSRDIIDATFHRSAAYKTVYLSHLNSCMRKQEYEAKFFIHTYYNIAGDNEDYFLQFRPGVRVPMGSYVEIPDDNGQYETWLIIAFDERPQFPLYYVLKCNWTLKWMQNGVPYQCLGVKKSQNSYNSGVKSRHSRLVISG